MASTRSSMWRRLALWCAACLTGCSERPRFPAIELNSPVATVSALWRLDSGEAVTSPIAIRGSAGFYAIIELRPVDNPGLAADRVTLPTQRWACSAVCYPAGESVDSPNAVRFVVDPLRLQKDSHGVLRVGVPPGPQLQSPDYFGPPRLANESPFASTYQPMSNDGTPLPKRPAPVVTRTFDKQTLTYWIFFGATHRQLGDYTLELFVHPFDREGSELTVPDAVSIYETTLTYSEAK